MIRIVTDTENPLAPQMQAIAAEAAASGAVVFMCAWETPDGTFHQRSVPDACVLRTGMADRLYDLAHSFDE